MLQSFPSNIQLSSVTRGIFIITSEVQDEIPEHTSFVIISECNIHDTVAVHLFQKLLVEFLKDKLGQCPKRICYFSDGCAAQYKNRKNFINLCHHEADFGVPAEWHFFATSHGKGPSDGIGGTIKRLAARASLQRPYDQQIITPRQLFEFTDSEIKNVNCQFTTTEQYEQEADLLKDRFEEARTIPGTQKLHSFIPVSKEVVTVRFFSSSPVERQERVGLRSLMAESETSDHSGSALSGYVTVAYNSQWWVACVKDYNPERHELEVTFLHPHGPSPSYIFPDPPDSLIIDYHDVLTTVQATTATGRTYSISNKETMAAVSALERKIKD